MDSIININGKDYELVLTTLAMKKIGEKYGGLEKLGDKFEHSDSNTAVEDIIWLLTLLINQGILRNNYKNNTHDKTFAEDEIALLTDPSEIVGFQEKISNAFKRGVERKVPYEKN